MFRCLVEATVTRESIETVRRGNPANSRRILTSNRLQNKGNDVFYLDFTVDTSEPPEKTNEKAPVLRIFIRCQIIQLGSKDPSKHFSASARTFFKPREYGPGRHSKQKILNCSRARKCQKIFSFSRGKSVFLKLRKTQALLG